MTKKCPDLFDGEDSDRELKKWPSYQYLNVIPAHSDRTYFIAKKIGYQQGVTLNRVSGAMEVSFLHSFSNSSLQTIEPATLVFDDDEDADGNKS
jgi:hypothetical protein